MALRKRAWSRLVFKEFLAAAVIISGLVPFLHGLEQASESHLRNIPLWNYVLALSLERSQSAKTDLEEILAKEKLEEPVKRLTNLVLEEWELPPSHERLTSPYPVWSPKLRLDGLDIERPLVVVLGLVKADGSFLPGEIKVSSGNPEVDKRCLDTAKKALFRPARRGKSYVEGRAGLSFNLYI